MLSADVEVPMQSQESSLGFRCRMRARGVYSQRGWRRARLLPYHAGLLIRHHRVLLNAHFIYLFFFLLFRPSSSSFIFADVGSSCRLRFPTGRPPWTGNGTHARSRARGSQCKAGVLKISLYDYHNNTTFGFPGFASLSQALWWSWLADR